MRKNLKILIIIVTFIIIGVIIIGVFINNNNKIIVCIDARTWWNRCWSV